MHQGQIHRAHFRNHAKVHNYVSQKNNTLLFHQALIWQNYKNHYSLLVSHAKDQIHSLLYKEC
jgi:hypothetical protein